MPVRDVKGLIEERVAAIRALHAEAGLARAEVDVSGGVDSAVVLGLLVRALGPAQVTAVFMGIDSSPAARARAEEVAATFGAPLVIDDLSEELSARVSKMVDRLEAAGFDREAIMTRLADDPSVLGSIRSCLRAPIGRGYNRMTGGGIRHGTGNECEDRFLRFYQKGGDGEVDTNPIGMLSKGEVYQLAIGLGVPRSVLLAQPSPDLWGRGDTHNDEDELRALTGVPWTYSRVDPETGRYRSIGTIERTSRFLDGIRDRLFSVDEPEALEALVREAAAHSAFAGLEPALVEALLRSARRIEAATRHKANPNVPMLGRREALIGAGLLTNSWNDEVVS